MPDRQSLDVDIVCVGFGPAMGGFLTVLTRGLLDDGTPVVESRTIPGLPPQVVCYERADDISFGVSGLVTRARGIRAVFPDLNPSAIPFAAQVRHEKLVYLLDPVGASRRSATLRVADRLIRALGPVLPYDAHALTLPYVPSFLRKEGGLVLSIGQFNQWVGAQLMGTGAVQIWPAMPVAEPLIENDRVTGVRLVDQGVDKQGKPEPAYMPGMDIHAALTVVADGPVGAVGRQLDEHFGLPAGHRRDEWAVGMKMTIDLREDVDLEPGTVIHTFGYPEPEIFGFMYVYPERMVSVGIFVPSWFENPARTAYRYLQHWMQHPYLWRYLQGGTLRSWGAKSLQESGRRGEPYLVGDGYARIGEGSGSTNVLTGSGVDEAWTTGVQLAEGVLQLLKEDRPFTKENLERAYVRRRRESWVETEGRVAERSRDGFRTGIVPGMIGMALAGLTKGKLSFPRRRAHDDAKERSIEDYYGDRIPRDELAAIQDECRLRGVALHDALMDRVGWPAVLHDGKLLLSQQDALLVGGKVQAAPGYADHVVFRSPDVCRSCGARVCIEMCSAQAIMPGPDLVPLFDREKCIHCGACLWSCSQPMPGDTDRTNIDFRAGAGGLHSTEN